MKLLDIIFESVVDLSEYGKSMGKDEFIRRAKLKHQNPDGSPKFTYDNVDYKTLRKNVLITCPIHGDFPQTPAGHLIGNGCRKCKNDAMRSNTQDFIRKAQLKHQNPDGTPKYTYDNVNYIGADDDVMITCPVHGDFPQTPHIHLGGSICPYCSIDAARSNKKEFVDKAQKVHQNPDGSPKYTYDNVNYVANNKNVLITCPIHGDFPQTPSNHLAGSGCKKCNSNTSNSKEFIEKAQKVHHNPDGSPKYTYDNVNYVNSKKNVLITCPIHSPIHGDFPQSPNNHLSGAGCPWCNESKGEKVLGRLLYEKNINYTPYKKYDDCYSFKTINGLSKKCKNLEFDFYLPDLNTLIEFDGAYHFKKIHNNHDYMNQVLNDREKNEYAKLNNIKLIRISYRDMKKIEQELMKGLESDEQLYLSTKYPIDKGWRDNNI